MAEFVYILSERDTEYFKIGISEQLYTRFNRLSRHHDFDSQNSYLLETEGRTARRVERLLHRHNSQFRTERSDHHGLLLDGGSEWFNKCCLLSTLYKIDRTVGGFDPPFTGHHCIKAFWSWDDRPGAQDSGLKTLNRPGLSMNSYQNKTGELYEADQRFFADFKSYCERSRGPSVA